jgi:hypothetical protein
MKALWPKAKKKKSLALKNRYRWRSLGQKATLRSRIARRLKGKNKSLEAEKISIAARRLEKENRLVRGAWRLRNRCG